MTYKSFINPCKTSSFLTIHYMLQCVMYIHYNAGAGFKEVPLKNHGNKSRNGLAILHGNLFLGSILNSNFVANPFSSDAIPEFTFSLQLQPPLQC